MSNINDSINARINSVYKKIENNKISNNLMQLINNLKTKTSTYRLRLENIQENLAQDLTEERKNKFQAQLYRLQTKYDAYKETELSLEATKDWFEEEIRIKEKYNGTLSLKLYNNACDVLRNVMHDIPILTKQSLQVLKSLDEMVWSKPNRNPPKKRLL